MIAVKEQNATVVELILDTCKADLTKTNNMDLARASGNHEIVRLLRENGGLQ
jgi:hypothetical protein